MLAWKKRKDGSLLSRSDKHEYRIWMFYDRKYLRDTCRLTKDGVFLYQIELLPTLKTPLLLFTKEDHLDWKKRKKEAIIQRKAAKHCCKEVAQAVEDGGKAQYPKILKSLREDERELYTFSVKETHQLHRLPVINGPKRDWFIEQAKLGQFPLWVVCKLGLHESDLGQHYMDSLLVECLPHIRKFEAAKWKEQKRKERKSKAKESAPKPPENVVKPPVETNQEQPIIYNGPAPEERSRKDLMSLEVIFYGMPEPPPKLRKPKNAKFSTLLKWGETIRDWYILHKNRFPTALFLVEYAKEQFLPNVERSVKAAKRVAAIWRDEIAVHRAMIRAMIEKAEREPYTEREMKAKKKRVERDWAGNREGTMAYQINQVLSFTVPKSPKRIAKESNCPRGRVSNHLKKLLELKLIVNERSERKPRYARCKSKQKKAKP